MELLKLLEELSNAHGLSGREDGIREIVKKHVESHVDEVRTDALGNLIATRRGGKPVVMLAAHMDEIGLMVKYIDDKGFLRFVKIGGWFDQTLLNQRVIVHGDKGPLVGVIGSKPPHVMKEEERKKPVKSEDMYIDIGAKNREEAEKLGVRPGSPVTSDQDFRALAGDMVTGKALDDRAGVAMLVAALAQLNTTKATVHAVFTVQEEVGLKGAKTSAFGLNPDVALAIDVTIPGDHPGIEKKDSALETGKGPSITVIDAGGRGLITHRDVLRWLEETARTHNIPYQLDVADGGTTDATAISLTREGIPAGVISTPVRYIHSPVSVLNIKDLETSAQLIARALENVEKYF